MSVQLGTRSIGGEVTDLRPPRSRTTAHRPTCVDARRRIRR